MPRTLTTLGLFAFITVLSACAGEQREIPLADGGGEVSGGNDGGTADAATPDRAAFVITTDYTTGSCAEIDLATRGVKSNLCPIHADAVARYRDGKVWVVNRLGQDNVQILDPAAGYATVAQYSVGAGSNPQDIAFANGKAYVTRQNDNKVLVVKPVSGETIAEVDLSAFADADGFCEPGVMQVEGSRVLVTVLRLDRNNQMAPAGKGVIAVIDSATDTLVGGGIPLLAANPWLGFARDGVYLYVANSGTFGKSDGDIELIDPDKLANGGITVASSQLGGDINYFTVKNGVIYAVVTDAAYNTSLVAWDTQQAKRTVVLATEGFNLAGVAINDRGELYVADRAATKPGMRIFDTKTLGELTAAPIDTGLPPMTTLFIK